MAEDTQTQQPSISILVACHKEAACPDSQIIKPIQVGSAIAKNRFAEMLHDDEGDNISMKNPSYCELTAQYWAWKNLDADYYGFCHYRRYFNFSEKEYKEDDWGNVVAQYINPAAMERYGLDDEHVRAVVGDNDIVITEVKDISLMPDHNASVWAQYEAGEFLRIEDLELLVKIIDEKYPDYSEAATTFLHGSTTSFCNMYILKRGIFFDYCTWLFDILGEFEKRADMSLASTETIRTPGHLSERLFGIYLKKHAGDGWKVRQTQCVLFEHPERFKPLDPAFGSKPAIPVVLAANRKFCSVLGTCLQSIIDWASDDDLYDIVVLESDIDAHNRKMLGALFDGHPNFSLRFFDVGYMLSGYKLEANFHITVETYYRFLIQSILPSYGKVLYLDCDLIVMEDLAHLFATDVSGCYLAAAPDPDFVGLLNNPHADRMKYAKETLKLEDPYKYFQAGVLLFNTDEMRKAFTQQQWLEFAMEPYIFSDQDVLNVHCEGHVKFLDLSWNMMIDFQDVRLRQVIMHAPEAMKNAYLVSRNHPKIIHYAGYRKPWLYPGEDFGDIFWAVARRTPYYEVLLKELSLFTVQGVQQRERDDWNAISKPMRAMIRMFPKGTRRGNFVRGIYHMNDHDNEDEG